MELLLLSIMLSEKLDSKRVYFWLIVVICISYLVIQGFYITYAKFSMDDLWLAYHTFQYKTGLPYRDFAPYKSVLGYYICLPPMILFHGVLNPLLYTKAWLVLINSFFLAGTSLWMKKFFSQKAVLTSLVLIITMPIFLIISSEIRVDLLAYWLCLISVLFLFEKKYFLAGLCIGIGFLISQKAIWYFIATNCGLAGYWIITERTWKMIKNIVSFNIGTLLTLLLYILFWSYYSSLIIVLKSLFYEPYFIYSVDWYASQRWELWNFIYESSPGLILLCPLAIIGLTYLPVKNKIFIIIYTAVIFFFLISCRQPFVYLPLVAVPALFVLFSSFFSALYSFLYISTQTAPAMRPIYFWAVFGIVLSFATAPMTVFIRSLPQYSGRYQKSMIHLVANLLDKGGVYIAGVPLLLDIEQPVPGLKHLIGPSIDFMHQPSKKLYTILSLSSLYFSPATVPEVIESIKSAPIKLYVDNDRFHQLPNELFTYLDTQYQHFWGSIYLYAPRILAGHQTINIKFPGRYKVKGNSVIYIDNKKMKPNAIIHLSNRDYISEASSTYRLTLIPNNVKHLLEPQYKNNQWQIMLD